MQSSDKCAPPSHLAQKKHSLARVRAITPEYLLSLSHPFSERLKEDDRLTGGGSLALAVAYSMCAVTVIN